ncbi:MAG: hypothetical protein H0X17_00665 [Deltaproteobacteria bacterium]|nr:hypothetical protein [Deltaproteobacteria bacterium]
MKRLLLLWLSLAALAACDAKATASDPQSGGAARAEQKSREYESCGASLHCQDNLRCFDDVCRRSARSAVGDYYAAVGAAARTRGETDAAIAAYAQALGQYDAEKLGIPPDVECAYGSTLAAGRAKKETAELAARVLHRCVLTVPAGSALRDAAFAQLATLAEAGLDPILLGAGKTADLYLSKAPARPSSDKLTIAVVATPQPIKSFAALQDKLTGAELRAGLVACWDAHFAATKKEALAVTVPVKSAWAQSEEYEDAGQYVQRFEPVAAGAPLAEACVRQVVEPAIKALKLNESFTSKLAITIK